MYKRQIDNGRVEQLANFDEFRSLGMSFDLSPSGLREALQEKGHTNDLVRSGALLKKLHNKIVKGIESSQITSFDAREFAQAYRDFAAEINPNSSKKAPQVQRAINHLANGIENRVETKEDLSLKPGAIIKIMVNGRGFNTVIDKHGVQRFPTRSKWNDLYEAGKLNFNQLARDAEVSDDQLREIYRDTGTSVCGYCEVFVADEVQNPLWD